jgi:hypothetical protein
LLSFLIQKTHKNSKGREGKRKGTHTKYCAKFLCKWGGAKVAPKKSMQWSVFFFSQWMFVHLCPLLQKRKISTTLDLFIYLFNFAMDIVHLCPKKGKKKEKEKKVHTSRREKK